MPNEQPPQQSQSEKLVVPNHVLRRVRIDNVRDVQIGGQTDGISEETARGLGYHSPEDAEEFSYPDENSGVAEVIDISADPSADNDGREAAKRTTNHPSQSGHTKKPYTGRSIGDSTYDTPDDVPQGHEEYKPLTEEEMVVSLEGVRNAKEKLENNRPE